MYDSTYNYNNNIQQQYAQVDDSHFRQPDPEMDLLMQTLEENPDFFSEHIALNNTTTFFVSSPSMALQASYEDNLKENQQQQMFRDEFYEPRATIQTPTTNANTPRPGSAASLYFEDFSLATQLPTLNGYASAYKTADSMSATINLTKFQPLEPYSSQYFFTTPPDTPPSMLPVKASVVATLPNLRQSSSTSTADPTPTIRKLLQQKKKRITAVPCHVNSVCSTCQTRTTSLWRRNHLGEIECNACNLYFRKNNCKRPVTLRKDEIMKRKRKPRPNPSHTAHNTVTNSDLDVKPDILGCISPLFT